MSIEALRWALDIGEEHDLAPPRRLVLIILGNSADHNGASLFPSVGWISRRTGMGMSTVRGHLAGLEEIGLLTRDQRNRNDGAQTSNAMQLAMPQLGLGLDEQGKWDTRTPPPESGGGAPRSGGGPASRLAGGGGAHTKVLKQEVSKGFQPPDWIPADAWKGYEAMRIKIRKPMTDRAREMVVKKLAAMKADGHDPRAVLEQSELHSWAGIYPIKQEGGQGATQGWWNDDQQTLAKAKELGIDTVGASWQQLRGKIRQKLEHPRTH